ncbi:MAG: pectate lyase-like adhesive domain-containing protein, partial [Lactobacillus panisapium]
MKRNSNLIEETKNTNYKMHKSKKGWLVSYSLLTFMLGGIYLGSSSTAPVKAADIDNQKDQKGVDQDLQKTVESKSLEDAKLNASTTINTEATTIKEKINSDLNLSSSKKAQQVKKVDALVTAAKTKVDAAANLADVKAVIEETVSNIDNAYEPGSVVTKAKSTAKKSTKKAPVISKNVKPASKKVGVTTYKGLSSFFKSASTSNGVTATNDNSAAAAATTAKTDKSEVTSSLVADSAANSATDSAKIAANNATTNTKVEGTSDNKAVDKRSTNDVTAQDEATPRIDTAADTDGGKAVAVGNDPDGGRNKFDEDLKNNPLGQTKTSVNIPTPDQVLHPDKYKTNVANVSTYAELNSAWTNPTVTYINITSDFALAAGNTIGNRSANASDVVINGNGHTVNLQRQNFTLSAISAANPTTVTLTNATFKQSFTNSPNSGALIYTTNGAGLTANFDNITLTTDDPKAFDPKATGGSAAAPNHAICARDAFARFSGQNRFDISDEVTRFVTKVEIANNSSVVMRRPYGSTPNSEFWFESINGSGDTSAGSGNSFRMGDNSRNEAYVYGNATASYPALYRVVNKVQVGDNVTWKQTGFQYFLDAQYARDTNGTYDFGQNFDLTVPVSTMPNAINLVGNQKATFAPGTKLDINQNYNGSIIQVAGTSSVVFTSPKSLHFAVNDGSGKPARPGNIISGSGSVTLNNSKISTWLNTNAQNTNPADSTLQFAEMTVKGGTAYVVPINAQPGTPASVSNIIQGGTREIQTLAVSVGRVGVQYVDQNGKPLSDKPIDLGINDNDNFVGQTLPFITDKYVNALMPKGYMWALGNQVYAGAKKDKQSGGNPISTDDDGDELTGQAYVGTVPMHTDDDDKDPNYFDYIYKIYVYGTPQKVSYQYVDYKTNRVLTSPLSGRTGTEAVGGVTPANYGNTIDWTNEYYKTDNVPAGYHYSTQAATDGKQPTTTQVTDNNPLVTIFVEGNEQTIPVSFVDLGNAAVSPINPVTVTGVTGQTITVPEAPEAINSQLDHIELNGKTVKAGDTFEMPDQANLPADQKYSLKYVYAPLDKNSAETELKNKRDELKKLVDQNDKLTAAQQKKVKDDIDSACADAIRNIELSTVDRPSRLETTKKQGLADIQAAYDNGVALETNRNDQKNKIDAEATTIKKAIDDDPTLTTAEKTDQKANVDKHAQLAKDNIDKATDAQGIKDAFDEGKTNIDNDHVPGDSVEAQRAAAKKQLEADAQAAKDRISKALDLDNEAKNKQTEAVDQQLTA